MLKTLTIKNYALIEKLELSPCQGLNIITGETGAGKSIMLGAIGLLLGARADAKALWDQEQKCVIEGVFDTSGLESVFSELELEYQPETIIRREVTASKSRSFVNDSPATLDALKSLGAYLVDIHSQHDSRLIGSAAYQLQLIDQLAGTKELLDQYQGRFGQWQQQKRALEDLQARAQADKQAYDYNLFQLKELQDAQLVDGEDAEAEAELSVLDNAEELTTRLAQTLGLLSQSEEGHASGLLRQAQQQLEKVQQLMPAATELNTRLRAAFEEVRDIAYELESLAEKVEMNPERQAHLNERISLIERLKKKHAAADIAQLLVLQSDLERRVAAVDNLDEHVKELTQKVNEAYKLVIQAASDLSAARKAILPKLEKELSTALQQVAMPMARLVFSLESTELPTPTGLDVAAIKFSANKGMELRDIKQVASGGEFSRVMLCIKHLLAKYTDLPTIIFDEIDTGISGEVALQVGQMVKQMAAKHQLLVITHLPQMAAQGHQHYYVYKDHSRDRTTSGIKLLTEQERVAELAQMMSGSAQSAAALSSAQELLKAAQVAA